MRACKWCDGPIPASRPRSAYCSENCRKRECDDRMRASCVDCGAKLSSGSAWASKTHTRCRPCFDALRDAEHHARLEFTARLYNQGASIREIAIALGFDENSHPPEVTKARAAGLITEWRYDAVRRRNMRTARWPEERAA